jgi:hypothetical protein
VDSGTRTERVPDENAGRAAEGERQVAEVRGGRIVWYRVFRNEEEALEAVRLKQ